MLLIYDNIKKILGWLKLRECSKGVNGTRIKKHCMKYKVYFKEKIFCDTAWA